MISGAAQADAALLVVDGSIGGFEAGFGDPAAAAAAAGGYGGAPAGVGQTREHAQLTRSLGVDQMAVVITKLDTCGYSQVGGGRWRVAEWVWFGGTISEGQPGGRWTKWLWLSSSWTQMVVTGGP